MTSVARTLLDLAADAPDRQLTAAFNQADRLGLINQCQIAQCALEAGNRKGAGRFRRLVELRHPLTVLTRSDLEGLFIAICDRHSISEPLVNEELLGKEVDCQWPGSRLVVELDGYEFHRGRMHFERDMRKDNHLKNGGYSVVHFSQSMLLYEVEEVAALVQLELERHPS